MKLAEDLEIHRDFDSLDRLLSKSKLHKYEEDAFALSGLELYIDLHIFDVPIYDGKEYIHTTRCGDGENKPVLLLLHGYCGTSVLYYPMLKHLAKKYVVYTIDFLGMGLSSKPDYNYKKCEDHINFFVESIEDWRNTLCIEKLYIAGHSFGGYMAGHYAKKYTDRVSKLFLLSPMGVTNPGTKTREEVLNEMSWPKRQFYDIVSGALWGGRLNPSKITNKVKWLGNYLVARHIKVNLHFVSEEYKKILTRYYTRIFELKESSNYCIHDLLKPPIARAHIALEDILQELEIPICVFFGDKDWMDQLGAHNVLASGKKDFKLEIIPQSGHQITMENPVLMAQKLLDEVKV